VDTSWEERGNKRDGAPVRRTHQPMNERIKIEEMKDE